MRNQGDKATGHTAMVLEALWKSDHPMTNAEISEATGIPASTVGKIIYNQKNKAPCPIERTEVTRKTQRGTTTVAAHALTKIAREIWDEGGVDEEPAAQAAPAPEKEARPAEKRGRSTPDVQKDRDAVEASVINAISESPMSVSALSAKVGADRELVLDIAGSLRSAGRVSVERIMGEDVIALNEEEQGEMAGEQKPVTAGVGDMAERISQDLGGQSMPMSTILRRLGTSDRGGVAKAMKELLDAGMAEIDNSKSMVRYRILKPSEAPKKAAAEGAKATPRGAASSPEAGKKATTSAKKPEVAEEADKAAPSPKKEAPVKAPAARAEAEKPAARPASSEEPVAATTATLELSEELVSSLDDLMSSIRQEERAAPAREQAEGFRQLLGHLDRLEKENRFWREFAQNMLNQVKGFKDSVES